MSEKTVARRKSRSEHPPPPPIVRSWVRLVVAFSASVALGLAPYLGKLRVPGFDALLSLIPDDLHSVALPLSAAFMGLIAVWIQWSAGNRPRKTWIQKRFRIMMFIGILGLILFWVVNTFVVVRIPIRAEDRVGVYLIGFRRLPTSPCPPIISDVDCVRQVTPEESQLAKVWGDNQLRISRLALLGSYFVATSSFGMLVGLIVLQKSLQRTTPRRRRGKRRSFRRAEPPNSGQTPQ
jgi:hypothetical protein